MSIIRFNFTTDHHFSHRTPGRRQGDYFSDLSLKLEQVAQHCNTTKSIPLFGGDLFHLKDPSKIAPLYLLKFMGDMAHLLSSFDEPPKCAIGNHDIRYDRLSTIPEQPLGLMGAAGKVDLLCPYDPSNLIDWIAPSGHTYLIPKLVPIKVFSSYEGSFAFVYSTPYIDDPQDLVAYLASEPFHTGLAQSILSRGMEGAVTGILLLHTLAGPMQTEFFGLQRAAYSQIHEALSRSSLGRSTSAVLFGHEHNEGNSYVYGLSQDPVVYSNLPPSLTLATQGTMYINPPSFSRSSIDYTESDDDTERLVYMVDLVYTPAGRGLSVAANQIPLKVRPITQLFGTSVELMDADPLNQSGVDTIITPDQVQEWTSFSDALKQLDATGENPEQFLQDRLKSESTEVISTVKALLTP